MLHWFTLKGCEQSEDDAGVKGTENSKTCTEPLATVPKYNETMNKASVPDSVSSCIGVVPSAEGENNPPAHQR